MPLRPYHLVLLAIAALPSGAYADEVSSVSKLAPSKFNSSKPDPVSKPSPPSPIADSVEPSGSTEQTRNDVNYGVINAFNNIQSIEDEYGVYDARLTEQLVGLGLAHQGQGSHADAISAFNRALHLSRVNDGLYGLSQIRVLQSLVESHVAEKGWQEANDRQQQILNIQQYNYGPADARLIPTLGFMVKWHLHAYQNRLGLEPLDHLLLAWTLNRRQIRLIEVNQSTSDSRLGEALYARALVNYQFALYQETDLANPRASVLTRDPRFSAPPEAEDEVRRRAYSIPAYRDGRKALMRRVELFNISDDGGAEKKGEALLSLGDWYLLFNKRQSALEAYSKSYRLYSESDRSRMEEIFNKPHALAFGKAVDFRVAENEDKTDKSGYVEAEFSITDRGKAKNIKIVDANPPKVKDSLVVRSIRATRYRPRIVEGQPVLTEGVTYRHEF